MIILSCLALKKKDLSLQTLLEWSKKDNLAQLNSLILVKIKILSKIQRFKIIRITIKALNPLKTPITNTILTPTKITIIYKPIEKTK